MVVMGFPSGCSRGAFLPLRGVAFYGLFERAAHFFLALRVALGGLAGSRLAVYFVLCTRGSMGVFACGAGIWRCSRQVVSVSGRRSLIGGVDDGKVVATYWRGFGVLGLLRVGFAGCVPLKALAFP
jgi:hypothetical protein